MSGAGGGPSYVDALVISYLQRKGFAAAASELEQETGWANLAPAELAKLSEMEMPLMEKALAVKIRLFNGTENYASAYKALREWVHGSLDIYKPELLRLLYPLLVLSYLRLLHAGKCEAATELLEVNQGEHEALQAHELQQLATLREPVHVEASELARRWLHTKKRVSLSRYPHSLLLHFLTQRGADGALTLALLNEHILFVQPGARATLPSEEEEALAPSGNHPQHRQLLCGLLDTSPLVRAQRVLQREAASSQRKGDPGPLAPFSIVESLLSKGAPPNANPLPTLQASFSHTLIAEMRMRVPLGGAATSGAAAAPSAAAPGQAPAQLPSCVAYTLLHAAGRVCCAALSTCGNRLAAGFADAAIRVWDAEAESETAKRNVKEARGSPLATLQGHAGPVYGLDWAPGDQLLLSCGADATVRLWSFELRAQLACFQAHTHPVWAVAVAPLGFYFASGSYDRTCRVWAMDSPHPRRVLLGHASDVDSVAWHPTCNYIATGSADRSVRLWEMPSGACVRVLSAHRSPPRVLSFSPDGKRLASGDDAGQVLLWELASSVVAAASPLPAQGGRSAGPVNAAVNAIAWSVEGAVLASGGEDGVVRVWDPAATAKAAAGAAEAAAAAAEEAPPVSRHVPELQLAGDPFRSREETQLQTLRFSQRNLLFAAFSR